MSIKTIFRGPFAALARWRHAGPDAPPAIEARRVDIGNIGRGFADPQHPGKKRIVVTVDEVTFARIRSLAVDSEISLAAAARHLIDRGFAAGISTHDFTPPDVALVPAIARAG